MHGREEARELLHFKRNGELVKEDGKSIERERETSVLIKPVE
jgi:hypothetical protein